MGRQVAAPPAFFPQEGHVGKVVLRTPADDGHVDQDFHPFGALTQLGNHLEGPVGVLQRMGEQESLEGRQPIGLDEEYGHEDRQQHDHQDEDLGLFQKMVAAPPEEGNGHQRPGGGPEAVVGNPRDLGAVGPQNPGQPGVPERQAEDGHRHDGQGEPSARAGQVGPALHGMGAAEDHVAHAGIGHAPLQQSYGRVDPQQLVAEERAASGGEDDLSAAHRHRGHDGARAEKTNPGQGVA